MASVESVNDCDPLKNPVRVLLFSGKRKSGKDYITDILLKRIGLSSSVIIKISGPIKFHWAKASNLDFNQLLSDGEYKEKYRLQMVKWSEDVRKSDYGYFCRAAIDMYKARDKSTWIVSDIRRKTDINWFRENFGNACKIIRIVCDDSKRMERGWIPTAGIDDAETECDLDDFHDWDLVIENNNTDIENIIQSILEIK